MRGRPKLIAVGMSGGVDSSVAALLIKDQGHEAVGVTMRIYGGGLDAAVANSCYGPDEDHDVADARRVCATIGIPFHEVDLREEFRASVLEYFRAEYRAGRTPNPCVRCNQWVKFGMLISKLDADFGQSFDAFATGHYAQAGFDEARGRFFIRKAQDSAKDQSYFLCMLSQSQLSRVLFPLGDLTKTQVRKIARERGLLTHDKADSQNFAGGDYRALLGANDPSETLRATVQGSIKNDRGEILGTHNGVWSYTVGQRRGLGISSSERLYVTRIDQATNTVFVGPASSLWQGNLLASAVNWVSIAAPCQKLRAAVRIRYQHAEAPAQVTCHEDGSATVAFDEPQKAVAPGQWAVFYDQTTLLGGGVIEKVW
jgi:tRNA-specific 2-thiouridylase